MAADLKSKSNSGQLQLLSERLLFSVEKYFPIYNYIVYMSMYVYIYNDPIFI